MLPPQKIVIAATKKHYDEIDKSLEKNGFVVNRIRHQHELTFDWLNSINPDWVFFPHWSWKIPSEIYQNFNCVIFHMTDLPYGRGGSPLQNLIVNGHQTTQISAVQCVEELDAGSIYLKRPLSLLGTADEILIRASDLIADMIKEILKSSIDPTPQVGDPTYFKRRLPSDSNIYEIENIKNLYDFIRMLDGEGYPPAFLDTEYFRLELSRASLKEDCVIADVKITRKPK